LIPPLAVNKEHGGRVDFLPDPLTKTSPHFVFFPLHWVEREVNVRTDTPALNSWTDQWPGGRVSLLSWTDPWPGGRVFATLLD